MEKHRQRPSECVVVGFVFLVFLSALPLNQQVATLGGTQDESIILFVSALISVLPFLSLLLLNFQFFSLDSGVSSVKHSVQINAASSVRQIFTVSKFISDQRVDLLAKYDNSLATLLT